MVLADPMWYGCLFSSYGTTWWSPFFSRSNTCLSSSYWNPSTHLALVFKVWIYPPSDAMLTPATLPITHNCRHGGRERLIPSHTGPKDTPSFAKKWRLQHNHWRKGSQLELTTPQQNWSKQVHLLDALCWPKVFVKIGKLQNSHDNLQQDLVDRRIADPMDPVLSHH